MILKNATQTFALPIVALLFQFFPSFAQPEPDFAWVKRIGNNSTGDIHGPILAVDNDGNSYTSGIWLPQSYTLDGITITPPVSTPNLSGGYIAKYGPNGQIIWAKSMTNIMAFSMIYGYSYPSKIIVDEQGNIYFTALGATDGHCIINGHYLTDPNATHPQNANRYNMFLAKLDVDGNVLWVKKTSHPFYVLTENIGRSTNEIHFDLEGNINMTGAFHSYISFNPGDTIVTAVNQSAIFLTKYAPSGNILLSKKLAGTTYPKNQFGTEHIRTDASGNLYRWSSRSANNPKRLYRYDSEGELLDSTNLAVSVTGLDHRLNSFAVNSTGDVFVGGYYTGNITIEGGTYAGFGNPNNTDAVIFKLAAPNYGVDWVKTHLTVRNDSYDHILTDAVGSVYATGQYGNAQEAASVIRKYADNGDVVWSKLLTGLVNPQNPNTGFVNTSSICQAQNGGNIWVGGRFSRNAYFSANDHFATPTTNIYNGFLVQYGLCNTANPVINPPLTTKICGTDSIILSANLNDPSLTYFWSTSNGTVAIGSNQTSTELTVTQPGKYFLVAQQNAECYGKSQEIWITQAPLPNNGATKQNNTLTATETAPGTNYQWLDCNNGYAPVSGADEASFTPAQNGSYAVGLTSQQGCTDTSACFIISNLGMDGIELNQLISIYPNPAKNEINIQTAMDIQCLRILDLQGKELVRTTGNKVNVSHLANGLYLIDITLMNGNNWRSKIVKE